MIHDVVIDELERTAFDAGWALTALRFSEPRLHRIALIQIVHLPPGARTEFRRRAQTDELWILVEGRVSFHWLDQREGSPSFEAQQEHTAKIPTRALAPFGVAFGVQADDDSALLIRLATEEDRDDVQVLDWPAR